jgi:hypothetical protein
MKLSQWARENNLHYRTALKLFHAGKLPIPAKQLESGTILVEAPVRSSDMQDHYKVMEQRRQLFLSSFLLWLGERPTRQDAETEVADTINVVRQLIEIHSDKLGR